MPIYLRASGLISSAAAIVLGLNNGNACTPEVGIGAGGEIWEIWETNELRLMPDGRFMPACAAQVWLELMIGPTRNTTLARESSAYKS